MGNLAEVQTQYIAQQVNYLRQRKQMAVSDVSLDDLLDKVQDLIPHMDLDEDHLDNNYRDYRGGPARFTGVREELVIELKEVHYLNGRQIDLEFEFGHLLGL